MLQYHIVLRTLIYQGRKESSPHNCRPQSGFKLCPGKKDNNCPVSVLAALRCRGKWKVSRAGPSALASALVLELACFSHRAGACDSLFSWLRCLPCAMESSSCLLWGRFPSLMVLWSTEGTSVMPPLLLGSTREHGVTNSEPDTLSWLYR